MSDDGKFARSVCQGLGPVLGLVALFFVVAGDAPPGVNEAHYLVKAKNFWQPDWCGGDLFAASGKAHATFYWLFGWPTQFVSLAATAWIGRLVSWGVISIGLVRLVLALGLPHWSSLVVAIVWIAGIEYGNLAGEWVIGGVEAKVPAYGLVLLGLAALVQRNWNAVWVWLGMAAALHALTGGWSVIAAMVAFALTERLGRDRTEPPRPFFTRWLVLGGAISLLGVYPAWSMSAGASPEDAVIAAKTYSYFRLSHHCTPAAFATSWFVRHAVVIAAATAFVWPLVRGAGAAGSRRGAAWRRLAGFGGGAIALTVIGLLIGLLPAVAPDLAAKLLRFYWFRLGDAMVPLVLGLGVACWLTGINALPRFVASTPLAVALALVSLSTWQRISTGVPVSVSNRSLGLDVDADLATQRRVMKDWMAVCQFVRASTSPDEVLLTPRHQQTFKWYAHRAEVVNWKDIPQDVASLREWSQRFVRVYPARLSTMRVTIRYEELRELRRRYGVRWMIVDRRVAGAHLPLVEVYPGKFGRNATYAVYELPTLRGSLSPRATPEH